MKSLFCTISNCSYLEGIKTYDESDNFKTTKVQLVKLDIAILIKVFKKDRVIKKVIPFQKIKYFELTKTKKNYILILFLFYGKNIELHISNRTAKRVTPFLKSFNNENIELREMIKADVPLLENNIKIIENSVLVLFFGFVIVGIISNSNIEINEETLKSTANNPLVRFLIWLSRIIR